MQDRISYLPQPGLGDHAELCVPAPAGRQRLLPPPLQAGGPEGGRAGWVSRGTHRWALAPGAPSHLHRLSVLGLPASQLPLRLAPPLLARSVLALSLRGMCSLGSLLRVPRLQLAEAEELALALLHSRLQEQAVPGVQARLCGGSSSVVVAHGSAPQS